MDLYEELLKEHSKRQTVRIVEWIGSSPDRFRQLMEIFLESEWLLVQRSAWAVGIIASNKPLLFYPYFERAINKLQTKGNHDAAIRNILRVVQDLDIPENLQGILVDLCLNYVETPKVPGGIKAFAISTLENLCTSYPELVKEVSVILRGRIENETPAFKSRANRFLKKHSDKSPNEKD